ncbi:MAG: hypothetical protein ACLPGW_13755 [Roseiarcus sp.]
MSQNNNEEITVENAGNAVIESPVVGGLVGHSTSKSISAIYYFLAIVALIVVVATYEIGYPFVITLALIGTAVSLAFIVYMTAADSFSKANRQALAANAKRGKK